MKFVPSIVGGKLPRDGTTICIALQFQGIDAGTQLAQAAHATRQTAPLENADLDFGHVQPAPVLGCVVKLDALQDALSFCGRKGFIALVFHASLSMPIIA